MPSVFLPIVIARTCRIKGHFDPLILLELLVLLSVAVINRVEANSNLDGTLSGIMSLP